MYADVLQIPEHRKVISKEYSSDFLSNRRPILIEMLQPSLLLEGADNTHKINQHIKSTIKNSKGNLALFFPSYAMMDKFSSQGIWLPSSIWPKPIVIEEQRVMSKREIENNKKRLYELESKGERDIDGSIGR